MFSEVAKFRTIWVWNIFQNFRILVTARELNCWNYSSEILYHRNITIFGVSKNMFSSTQKQAWTGMLYKNRSSLAF